MHACIHTHKHTYITLHCIALHCIALHCITLHCIALHCVALRCIALHCIALHTCIHTYIQAYIHTHIHTYTHTHIHTYRHMTRTHTPNICVCTHISIQYAPVVPARGGAEVALGIYYKTFLIYRTCMRRAPARPVRAFFFEAVALQSKNMACARPQCNNAKRTFSSHFALHFANGILKGKSPAPKLIKFADKSQSQP